MNKPEKIAIMIGLLLCMGVSTIMQTYFSSALPAISNEFQSVSFYSWVHGSYILASSSVLLLSSSLCQKFGSRRNFIAGCLLFGVGTILAPFSRSMLQLVISRVVMGIGAGITIPATYGMIGEFFERKKFSTIFAAFAVVQIISNGLGSICGGYLPGMTSWRVIFCILLPIELLSFFLVYKNIPKAKSETAAAPFHIRQHLFMIAAILFTAIGIEEAYNNRYLLLISGIMLLSYTVWKDIKKQNILLPKEFRSDPLLRNLCIQVLLLGMFYNVCLTYLPGIMQFSMGLSADIAGVMLTVFVVCMGIGSILGGIIKISERLLITITWLICFAGSILTPVSFVVSVGLSGLGSGILMSVLLGYTASRTKDHAAGVNSTAHLIRNFGGSIGTILFQFSLNTPVSFYVIGIIILTLLSVTTALMSFRIKQ